jgi:hypothetical protein
MDHGAIGAGTVDEAPGAAGATPESTVSGERPAPGAAGILGRLAVRAEDLLLAGWVVLAAPLLAQAGGTAGPFDSGHPVQGVLLLAGFLGALACLATRSPAPAVATLAGSFVAATPADGPGAGAGAGARGTSVLDSAAIGPLVGGLMLVGATGLAELGADPLTAFYPTIIAVLVLSLAQSHLPTVSTPVRRAMVTPYLLAAGGIFWGIVHAVTGGLDIAGQFGSSATDMSSGVAVVAGAFVLGAAVCYAMLIYAPRQIADREGGPIQWLARFALFVASVAVGVGWLSLLGG